MGDKYYRVRSTLRQPTGFNYTTIIKDKHDKDCNRSHTALIPGKHRPTDGPAITYITESVLKGIMQSGHNKKISPFKFLVEETQKGAKHGITFEECLFTEMPKEFQKKFNPKYLAKLEADRKKAADKKDKDKK